VLLLLIRLGAFADKILDAGEQAKSSAHLMRRFKSSACESLVCSPSRIISNILAKTSHSLSLQRVDNRILVDHVLAVWYPYTCGEMNYKLSTPMPVIPPQIEYASPISALHY
jgi:hypothetical protein